MGRQALQSRAEQIKASVRSQGPSLRAEGSHRGPLGQGRAGIPGLSPPALSCTVHPGPGRPCRQVLTQGLLVADATDHHADLGGHVAGGPVLADRLLLLLGLALPDHLLDVVVWQLRLDLHLSHRSLLGAERGLSRRRLWPLQLGAFLAALQALPDKEENLLRVDPSTAPGLPGSPPTPVQEVAKCSAADPPLM